MFHQLHTVNSSKNLLVGDLGIGSSYPISMSLTNFMDFFSDVRTLNISALGISKSLLPLVAAPTSLVGAIEAINESNNDQTSFVQGIKTRRIKPIGLFNAVDGSDLKPSQTPTTLTDYPYWSVGGGTDGLITIDFGQTKFLEGLFFPKIEVLFANGMSSMTAGNVVGGITFDKYGSIPIFGNTSGAELQAALGTISIIERYSDFQMDKISGTIGESITITAKSNNDLKYTKAFFGWASSKVSINGKVMTFTIPPNAESGPIRIESDDPQFDFFLTENFDVITS